VYNTHSSITVANFHYIFFIKVRNFGITFIFLKKFELERDNVFSETQLQYYLGIFLMTNYGKVKGICDMLNEMEPGEDSKMYLSSTERHQKTKLKTIVMKGAGGYDTLEHVHDKIDTTSTVHNCNGARIVHKNETR